jgi:putative DNA primase/helicase
MNPRAEPLSDPAKICELVELQVDRERAEYAAPAPEQDAPLFTSKEILHALACNEDGDAGLYIETHRGRFCYDHAAGLWYKWAGHYWQEDLLWEATEAIGAVIEQYGDEAKRQAGQRLQAEKAKDTDAAKKHADLEDALIKRIRALQSVNRKQNILILARTGAASLGITGHEWDTDPGLLGCNNGVINLTTGQHQPGQPGDYIKTIAPHVWRGINEPAPLWENFIQEIFNADQELIEYIHKLLGYCLTGLTRHHIYLICFGLGRNGKGTMFEALQYVLGDLSGPIESEMVMQQTHFKQAGAPDSAIMALRGKRLVWASESEEGRKFNVGKLKWLTGGDTLTGRAPFGRKQVTFRPTHKLFLLTNYKPQAPANDYALWARLHLIPFTLSFISEPQKENERKADPELLEKLKQEAPGILAWLVRGCFAWRQEKDLKPPESVRAATRQYQKDEDIIGQFIDERCIIGQGKEVKAGDLYAAYKQWCDKQGLEAKKQAGFGTEIKKRFDSQKKHNVFYTGIDLVKESDTCDT